MTAQSSVRVRTCPWRVLGLLFLGPFLLGVEDEPITVNPNRPTFATPSLTTQPGVAEGEWGLQHSHFRDGMSDGTPTLLKLGMVKDLELRISTGGYLRTTAPGAADERGMGDLGLAVQWCYTHHGIFGMDQAVQLYHKFPTAARALGTGQADDSLGLFFSRDVGPNHVDVNLIQNWLGRIPGSGSGREGQTAATLSVSHSLSEAWSVTGEIYGFTPIQAQGTYTSTLWCLARKISSRLVLDGGIDCGLSHDAPRLTLFAGLTYGIGRFKKASGN